MSVGGANSNWLRNSRSCGPLALALAMLLATATLGQSADAPVVESDDSNAIIEVRVEGNRRVEAEAIRRALVQKKGDKFDPNRTPDDLRSLWSLKYFEDLQLLVQRTPKGVAYVVRVKERPAVRTVKLQGMQELSTDDFKDAVSIKPYSILDLAAVRRDIKKVQDKYIEKGFYLAEVTYELKPVENLPEVDVIFVISEHAKVMVKEINFLGTIQVSADDLKAVMATHEGGYLSFFNGEGNYREELFQRDLLVIQSLYYDRGFVNVKVEKPTVTLSPDKRNIYISIKVEEGSPFKVSKVDFTGDLLGSKEEFKSKMTSLEGQLFSKTLLGRDIQTLTDIYYDQGYAYANINPVTNVHVDEKTIDLTYDIQKGNLVTIERIEIVGNTKTRDKVIRRQLRVYEGDLFNGTGMRKSKERAMALGFFESVEVTNKPGSDDKHAIIQVEVKEKSTGSFQIGMGFSTFESFIFTAQIAQNNFVGWGQSVSFSGQISGQRQLIQLSYFDPYFLDTNYIFSTDLYRTYVSYDGFLRSALGGSVNLGYYLMDDLSVNGGYTLEQIKVDTASSTGSVDYAGLYPRKVFPSSDGVTHGAAYTSAIRLSTTWDHRNNRLYPSSGHMQFASAEFAPGFLGGTMRYARYTAFSRFYFPLPLGAVFKTNATIGYMNQLEHDKEWSLPPSEKYYLGGITSLRGYSLRSVSPRTSASTSIDPKGSQTDIAVGGNKQFYFNAELEFPILEKVGIRGVAFFDAGNVFCEDANYFQNKQCNGYRAQDNLPLGLLYSIGFGVRWFSPVGPLRFEWGFPLTRRQSPHDDAVQFEFNIGNSF